MVIDDHAPPDGSKKEFWCRREHGPMMVYQNQETARRTLLHGNLFTDDEILVGIIAVGYVFNVIYSRPLTTPDNIALLAQGPAILATPMAAPMAS